MYGLGAAGGQAFGPVGESGDKVLAAYLELMGAFGVSASDARRFPPFVRGFWGEKAATPPLTLDREANSLKN